MAKIAILKVGGSEFALPPKIDAGKILAALSQAEHVNSRGYGEKEIFFPAGEFGHYSGRIELRYVDARQIRPCAPKNDEDGPLTLKA